MPKKIGTLTMDGKRKTDRPCKRWWDGVEVHLNIKEKKKTGRQLSQTVGN
jgi:hypothetical protein